MTWIALKMLMGDRPKYIGLVAGVTFAALLIAQQLSICCGLLLRTTSTIQDVEDAGIWVMDQNVEFIDEAKPLTEDDLYRVQGVPGVAWAVRFYKGQGRLKVGDGLYQQVIVLGVDDQTLTGCPRTMVRGSLAALRDPDAVVMDESGFKYLWPNESLDNAIGKVLEMNDHRAVIVGLCKASDTFQTFPILYTRYHQAIQFVPQERRVMSFVLADAAIGEKPEVVCKRIEEITGRKALTREQWIWTTMRYFMARTGIIVNFGMTTFLGFFVGCAIAGQTFYTFTLENLNQFGSLKAMGVNNRRIMGMVIAQALVVGLLGYGLGAGGAAIFGSTVPKFSKLAFYMPWQVLVGTGAAVGAIMLLSSIFSVRKVMFLEPAVVFR
jgi:putative ABC transport system permease protein